MEEEILPHGRSVQSAGEEQPPRAADPIAEERRLFYVGITRARNRLTLSGCATRSGFRKPGKEDEPPSMGEAKPRQPSRFLAEVPRDLMEMRSPGAQSSLTPDESKTMKGNFFASV
ncbi:MAG: rep [Gemmatimonadetes bacterium]|nr:rep [Gemmatimonadota bacterium]